MGMSTSQAIKLERSIQEADLSSFFWETTCLQVKNKLFLWDNELVNKMLTGIQTATMVT